MPLQRIAQTTTDSDAARCWHALVQLATRYGHATLDLTDPEQPAVMSGRRCEGRTAEEAMALAAHREGLDR